jgi:CrcB protein
LNKWIYLALGSIAGGVSRYVLGAAIHERLGFHFPYGTLIINLTGCFLIGVLNSLVDSKPWVGPNERLLLMTGFCGAYTTFSSFMLETSNLLNEGEPWLATAYLTGSVVVGFLVFRAGSYLGQLL